MAVSETVAGWGILLAASSVTAAVIVNNVLGNYEDSKGHAYGAVSNRASAAVAAISAALVTPKERSADPATDGVTHGAVATKTFTITNDSNITDAYQITGLTVSAGSVVSVSFKPAGAAPIPVTVGSTISPPVAVGGSMSVAVTVATGGARIDSGIEVKLTVKTTAKSQSGPQSDSGTAWVWVARGPEIVGLGSAPVYAADGTATGPPVAELVNGFSVATAEPGGTLTFEVPFTNVGDVPAAGLTVTAQLPPALAPVAGSAHLQVTDGRSGKAVAQPDASVAISANTVRATVPLLFAGLDVRLAFQATVTATAPIGTILANSATIGAQTIANVTATPAMLLIGAMNTVYDPLAANAQPVAGATVALIDAARGGAAKLAGAGVAPNLANANPFTTSDSGTFSFALPTARALDYELDVAAPQYVHRRIKVTLTTAADGLPTTTLSALDALPLAIAGGFTLTSTPVTVAGIAGFFGNIPLFAPRTLSLAIAADRTTAGPGDRVRFNVDYGPGAKPVDAAGELVVRLPAGIAYARNTARLGTVPIEPEGMRELMFAVKDLRAARTLTFDGVVLPATSSGATLSTRAGLSTVVAGAPLHTDASCDLTVTGGPLGTRGIISGRVFADRTGDGRFSAGDTGIPAVRIFLEDGESALTDLNGRFSFPATRSGMHVLHLDPITLPPGLRLYHGFPVNDPRSGMRLVHGIFDSGLMDDINFAVAAAPAGAAHQP